MRWPAPRRSMTDTRNDVAFRNPVYPKEWARKSLLRRWMDDEVAVGQWFERGFAHVHIFESGTDATIAQWHDEDVFQLLEDGFFRPSRRPELRSELVEPRSVIEYASDLGISAYPKRSEENPASHQGNPVFVSKDGKRPILSTSPPKPISADSSGGCASPTTSSTN